jgi:hypothetical protein
MALIGLLAVTPAAAAGCDHGDCRHGDCARIHVDGETINLADLADGETRTFGDGEHQIVATRYGDEVTIEIGDTEVVKTLTCSPDDECVIILSDEGEAMKLMVKTIDGDADGHHLAKEVMVMALGDAEGHEEMNIFVTADGEGEWISKGDGEANVFIATAGDGHHWISKDGEHHGMVRIHSDGVVLRCPEGDTTMHLKKGEEDEGPYYCPRHDVELKKVERKNVTIKELKLHDKHDD